MTQCKTEPTALQIAALLLLARLAHFFCCGVPYSTAYARGVVLTGLLEGLFLLPFFLRKAPCRLPRITKNAIRISALFLAAKTVADTYRFLCQAEAPQPLLTTILLLAAAFYVCTLTPFAVCRAAVFLLFFAAAAFLLLPFGGIDSAKCIHLWSAVPQSDAVLQEWECSAEIALLPLFFEKSLQNTKRAAGIWLIARTVFLPLVIVYGAMQCGRLQTLHGNPFLLLLSRVPFSDTIRTDGFWLMLVVGCCVLTVLFLMQIVCENPHDSCKIRYRAFAVLTAFSLLWIAFPPDAMLFAVIAVLLTAAAWIPAKECAA